MKLNEITAPRKFLTDEREIIEWLHSTGNEKCVTIHADGTVDKRAFGSDGGIDFDSQDLTEIPVKFGKVTGVFSCIRNRLTSYDSFPSEVTESIYCDQNPGLTSLIGIADIIKKVGGTFDCPEQTSEGGLGLLLIDGLDSVNTFGESGKIPDDNGEYLVAGTIIGKYLGRPDEIFACQAELIEQGLEAYAQL